MAAWPLHCRACSPSCFPACAVLGPAGRCRLPLPRLQHVTFGLHAACLAHQPVHNSVPSYPIHCSSPLPLLTALSSPFLTTCSHPQSILLQPKKKEALAWLDGAGPAPPRYAKVIVVRGQLGVRDVMEYQVGAGLSAVSFFLWGQQLWASRH